MMTKAPGETYSNVVRLVSAIYPEGFAKITADQSSKCLLVFAVLLHPDVNCGNLIHIFKPCVTSDFFLSHPDMSTVYNDIVKDLEAERPLLPDNYEHNDYRSVTRVFDQVRWAFCPATLDFQMNSSFPYGPQILPFCHGQVINKKGGTANVHYYKIREDLVVSDKLKEAIALSRHKYPEFGWVC